MNYLTDKIKHIQAVWKQLTLLGTWMGTIAGSFLLPLPSWDSEEEHSSHTRFILFIATVLAGFVLLSTYRYKSKKLWTLVSFTTFLLLAVSFYLYTLRREANTLPYYGMTKVIGSATVDDFEQKLKLFGLEKYDRDLLKYVAGDSRKLWTKESIDSNRYELIVYLTISYCLLAVFIISFVNVLILYAPQNESL